MPLDTTWWVELESVTGKRVFALTGQGRSTVTVGAGARADFRLYDPTIAPFEFSVACDAEGVWLCPLRTDGGVTCNASLLTARRPLVEDSRVILGHSVVTVRRLAMLPHDVAKSVPESAVKRSATPRPRHRDGRVRTPGASSFPPRKPKMGPQVPVPTLPRQAPFPGAATLVLGSQVVPALAQPPTAEPRQQPTPQVNQSSAQATKTAPFGTVILPRK